MRKLFKYLFLLLVAAVFWNGKGLSVSSVPDDVHMNVPFQETICSAELSEVDSEPCLPRQITFSTTFRIQGAAKRINNTYRNNLEFEKSGKVVNVSLRYFNQIQSNISFCSLMEPAQKLVCLRKLII